MFLEVLVHEKLCEQRKCYPDSTCECRAKSLVSENNKKSTMHKQWGVKKHFSQVLVADILKEREMQSCSQSFIKFFYYNFFKAKCIISSMGNPSNWWGNTHTATPARCGSCSCYTGQDKEGRSNTALSVIRKCSTIQRFLKTSIPYSFSVSATSEHCYKQSSGSWRTLPAATASQSTYQTTHPSQQWPWWMCGLVFLSSYATSSSLPLWHVSTLDTVLHIWRSF